MTTLAPPPAPVRNTGPRRLFTGPSQDPRWARPAFWAVLVLATALYAWNLSSVTGNTFYNAALYSGTGGGTGGDRRPGGTGDSGSTGQSEGQPPTGNAPSGSGSSDTRSSGSSSSSSTSRGGGMGGGTPVTSEMITYLKKNQDGATWPVAVATDQTASSIILESGDR